jgi:hypothetical protein
MTDWFRSWNGAPNDPKWGAIAEAVGCKPIEVSGLVWALLDYASQQEDRGSIKGFPARVFAHSSGLNKDLVSAILAELSADDIGVIVDDRFKAWEKRQPKREDSSTERVRAHRKRNETHGNAPEQSRTDKNIYVEISAKWNAVAEANGLAQITRLSEKRKTALQARLHDYTPEQITEAIDKIPLSPFLLGDSRDGWKADFDFLLRPDSVLKIIEGKYDRNGKSRDGPVVQDFAAKAAELERRYATQ